MPLTPLPVLPMSGDETTLLRAFLDHHRATVRRQCEDLDAAGLAATLGPGDLTLGGMLKHLAFVEAWWFRDRLLGTDIGEPWASVDWDADHDWDWHSAVDDPRADLLALYDAAVADSEQILAAALAHPEGLDQRAARGREEGNHPTLRWILLHLVREYARHAGHADLIRESVDGVTGR